MHSSGFVTHWSTSSRMSIAMMPLSRRLRAPARGAGVGVGVGDLPRATTLPPVVDSRSQPSPGAFDHGVTLQLGGGSHDREHGVAHRAVCLKTLGQAAEADAASGQLLDDGEDVLSSAPSRSSFQISRTSPSRRWSRAA